jgi:chemotaxis protein histidine kinase CheA
MANKPTKAEYEGFKKAIANPMTPQPIKDKLQSVIDKYASEYEGTGESATEVKPTKAPRKPRTTKTTSGTKRAVRKTSTTAKPTMSKADAYEKAKADLKAKTGKTEEECEKIINQYRELRAKAQTRKAKEEEASKGNKKRLEKLEEKGDLIAGTNEKTADAVIETTTKDVAEKIVKEIEAIEDKAEKDAKAEVAKDKTLKTSEEKKEKVAEKVKEKVSQKTKPMVQRIVIDTSALLTSIATTLGKFDKDSQKEFLIKLRSDIDKLLTKYAFGGMTNGAVQTMNIQQSNLSSSSVNPSQFANGGGVGGNVLVYEYNSQSDYEKNNPLKETAFKDFQEAESFARLENNKNNRKFVVYNVPTMQYFYFGIKKFANGGGVDDISYDALLDLLKEKLEDSVNELPRHFENSYNAEGEEVEHKSRDGFIAFTDGGYEVRWFETLSYFSGSGYGLPTLALDNEKDRQIEYNYTIAKERFMEEYPEIVEELGEESIDYNSLYDAGY